MNNQKFNDFNKAEVRKNITEQKLKKAQNDLKVLELKKKLLTKSGRNKFIFNLGLKAEPYIEEPEFLTDENLDTIFLLAFNDDDPNGYMRRCIEQNKSAWLSKINEEQINDNQ